MTRYKKQQQQQQQHRNKQKDHHTFIYSFYLFLYASVLVCIVQLREYILSIHVYISINISCKGIQIWKVLFKLHPFFSN